MAMAMAMAMAENACAHNEHGSEQSCIGEQRSTTIGEIDPTRRPLYRIPPVIIDVGRYDFWQRSA